MIVKGLCKSVKVGIMRIKGNPFSPIVIRSLKMPDDAVLSYVKQMPVAKVQICTRKPLAHKGSLKGSFRYAAIQADFESPGVRKSGSPGSCSVKLGSYLKAQLTWNVNPGT